MRAVPSCLTLDYNHSCSHSSDCATQICELGYCCQTPLPTATGLSTAFHQWGEINSCCADGLTYCCSSYFLSYGAQFVFANDGQGDIKYTKTNAIEGNLAFRGEPKERNAFGVFLILLCTRR